MTDRKPAVPAVRPDPDLDRVRRQQGVDMARAANQRQGYVHDPILEAGQARYVLGEITMDELRAQMLTRFKRS